MSDATEPRCPADCAVTNLITFAHVADVEQSLAFYALLGFTPSSVMRHANRTFWASAASGRGEIMFAQADGDPVPEAQAVLFYMYSEDVAALRAHLLSAGLHDGGVYCGQAGPNNGRRVVFEVAQPHYMPDGEIRVADPDGYCILVGQLG